MPNSLSLKGQSIYNQAFQRLVRCDEKIFPCPCRDTSFSDPIHCMPLPNGPDNVKATSIDGGIILRWDPYSGATGYTVYYSSSSEVRTDDRCLCGPLSIKTKLDSIVVLNTDTTDTIKNLSNGWTYIFWVSAGLSESHFTNLSKYTDGIPDSRLATNLKSEIINDTIVLSWVPSPDMCEKRLLW
jgi:hypothetical protein